MSFLDNIVDFGKSALGFLSGGSLGGNIAKAALSAFALNKITASMNKENQIDRGAQIDPGVRIQVDPDPEYKIPVVYGQAVLGGAVTDAQLTNNNQTMWYCLTICERTGNTGLGSGPASTFTFRDIYWDDNRLVFDADGITVNGHYDKAGAFCGTIAGAIKIYCYAGNSLTAVVPYGYTNNSLAPAYTLMPGWTINHSMDNLIFALVRIDYSASKDVTKLGDIKFKIQNSMNQPGDCLYDYMTNTRYGAGIASSEIYSL